MVKNPRLSQEVGETFYEKNNYELILVSTAVDTH